MQQIFTITLFTNNFINILNPWSPLSWTMPRSASSSFASPYSSLLNYRGTKTKLDLRLIHQRPTYQGHLDHILSYFARYGGYYVWASYFLYLSTFLLNSLKCFNLFFLFYLFIIKTWVHKMQMVLSRIIWLVWGSMRLSPAINRKIDI